MKSRANHFLITSKLITTFGDTGEVDGKEIITGMLRTFYKADDAKIAEILKEGRKPEEVMADIAALDKTRVTSLKTEADKAKFQEGYKKGKSESLTALEQEIKDEYGIESESVGLELLKEVIAAKVTESGGDKSEEEIKKSATYQALEKRMKKELEQQKTTAKQELDQVKKEYESKQTFTKVGENALTILGTMEPVWSPNAKVAETHKRGFLGELQAYEYEVKEDGSILVSKGGKLLEDEHGNTLSYEDHVKRVAENHFEFKQNNGGENSGNNNDEGKDKGKGGDKGYPAGVKKPTNADELAATLSNDKLTPAQKRVVMETYKKDTAK